MKNPANNYVWFLETPVNIRISGKDNADGISGLEHQACPNDSPPLHVHQNEDEIFYDS